MRRNYESRITKILHSEKDDYKKAVTLINELRKELSRFTFEDDFSNLSSYIKAINKIIPNLSAHRQKLISREISKFRPIVHQLLSNRSKDIPKDNPNFMELKNIIDSIEGMNLSLIYNYVDKYDGDAYNLIRYLLFEEKSLFFVKYALSQYPHLINLHDKSDKCLMIEVVERYIAALTKYVESNLEISDDLFFYDQVLENMLEDDKIDYSNIIKSRALKIVQDFVDNYDCSNLSVEAKNKLYFWKNELLEKLEESNVGETLGHLSYKTDITINFNEAIVSETRRFDPQALSSEYAKRELVKDHYIVTIDGDEAEEIDDGISVDVLPNGNYYLGVHIADPLGYMSKNNILYEEAERRTTSIYAPLEKTSSMYPESYAKDYMSLLEGKRRLGTSYYMEITPSGDILLEKCCFKKSIIKVDKGLTYDHYNELSKEGTDDERLQKTMINLQGVIDALSKKVVMDEKYRLASHDVTNSKNKTLSVSDSEKIVEYAMLAANSTVANYMAKKGYPFIYRGHELSRDYLRKIDYFDRQLQENPTTENYDVFVKILRDTYPIAFYTTDSSIGHMGIGIPHYSHVTSPLRRFADCLATEALDMFYFNTPPDDKTVYDFEDRLKKGCRHINEKKKTIDYFTRQYVKIKKN